MKLLTPSPQLAAIVGYSPLTRSEVRKYVWVYIKKHNLQDPKQVLMINADAKLRKIFNKRQVSMFEMTELIDRHLT